MLKAQLCWKSSHLISIGKTRLALSGAARLDLAYALVEGLVEGYGLQENYLASGCLALESESRKLDPESHLGDPLGTGSCLNPTENYLTN